MAKKYTVASETGAVYFSTEEEPVKVGDTVSVELSESDERAMVCAGWLDHYKKEDK